MIADLARLIDQDAIERLDDRADVDDEPGLFENLPRDAAASSVSPSSSAPPGRAPLSRERLVTGA